MVLLQVKDIHTYYGKIHALKGISLEVNQGEIVTLIGSNGAGKTTTLNTISGITPPKEGQIILQGEDITRLKPHEVVEKGLVQSPEGRKIFGRLSVRENLDLGAYSRTDTTNFARDLELVYDIFPRLKERQRQLGGTLSGGEQQMLAIGRALMARPKILLLDEPSMGLAPLLVRDIFAVINQLNTEQQTTILLVEQNAQQALTVAHRGYVLQSGNVVMADDADVLLQDESVRSAYLGEH
jgi:branched-chain amino acid transport system ATP-binding protein